jgi:hypothetical protein
MFDRAPMTFFLTPLSGVSDIPVGAGPAILGRDPLCEVWIDSPRVSRRHCCLTEDAGAILVRDLGSTNGTRINGRGVASGRLVPGDELAVAHLRFRLLRRPLALSPRRVGSPGEHGGHAHDGTGGARRGAGPSVAEAYFQERGSWDFPR